jgi:integrase
MAKKQQFNAKDLQYKTKRLALAPRGRAYMVQILPGQRLGYRRPDSPTTPGTFCAAVADGNGSSWQQKIGFADDFDEANGRTVFDFWQAAEQLKKLARASDGGDEGEKPITVKEALDVLYRRRVTSTGSDYQRKYNEGTVNFLLRMAPPSLLAKSVALVTKKDLNDFRDILLVRTRHRQPPDWVAIHELHKRKGVPLKMLWKEYIEREPDGYSYNQFLRLYKKFRAGVVPKPVGGLIKNITARRYMAIFLCALRLAADNDRRITNRAEWKLEALPDDSEARNVILPAEKISAVIAAAYTVDRAFALLVEVGAATGARPSQLLRMSVADLLPDDRLAIPRSRKGTGKKLHDKTFAAIPAGLDAKLRVAAAGRLSTEPLFIDSNGEPWKHGCQINLMRKVVEAAGLPSEVTFYALRHSHIVALLLANVPIRLVASLHDTSVEMIEKHYSRYITTVGDKLVRDAMIDYGAPPASAAVIPLRREG